MWIPADWMVWTYIAVLALMTVASFAIAFAEDKTNDIHATDSIGSLASIVILHDWFSDRTTHTQGVLWLLILIYTLATLEATIRAIRRETFEDEEEAKAAMIFSVVFIFALSFPIYYLAAVMVAKVG
jgi:hypothetical protein